MSKYLLIVFITLFMTAGNDSSALSRVSAAASMIGKQKHAAQSSKSAPAGDRFRAPFTTGKPENMLNNRKTGCNE